MAEVLVIKLSALGDFILATGCFKAIRGHHPHDRITLLTTKAYEALGRASGYFDEVVVDPRAKAWNVPAWAGLLSRLRGRRFARVYDLQRKGRTALIWRALGLGRRDLEWSGVVPGCSHYVPARKDEDTHILEKLAEQMRVAGIDGVPTPDIGWLGGGSLVDALRRPYALMTVGTAPTRPEKLAPAELYGAVANWLDGQGVTPVLVGTPVDGPMIAAVAALCPQAVDLCGRTSFADLADLGRGAVVAVGNDTGPMHLFSAAGCPVVVLFSHGSDPRRVRPRGPVVEVLQRANLHDLPAAEVQAAIGRVRRPAPVAAQAS